MILRRYTTGNGKLTKNKRRDAQESNQRNKRPKPDEDQEDDGDLFQESESPESKAVITPKKVTRARVMPGTTFGGLDLKKKRPVPASHQPLKKLAFDSEFGKKSSSAPHPGPELGRVKPLVDRNNNSTSEQQNTNTPRTLNTDSCKQPTSLINKMTTSTSLIEDTVVKKELKRETNITNNHNSVVQPQPGDKISKIEKQPSDGGGHQNNNNNNNSTVLGESLPQLKSTLRKSVDEKKTSELKSSEYRTPCDENRKAGEERQPLPCKSNQIVDKQLKNKQTAHREVEEQLLVQSKQINPTTDSEKKESMNLLKSNLSEKPAVGYQKLSNNKQTAHQVEGQPPLRSAQSNPINSVKSSASEQLAEGYQKLSNNKQNNQIEVGKCSSPTSTVKAVDYQKLSNRLVPELNKQTSPTAGTSGHQIVHQMPAGYQKISRSTSPQHVQPQRTIVQVGNHQGGSKWSGEVQRPQQTSAGAQTEKQYPSGDNIVNRSAEIDRQQASGNQGAVARLPDGSSSWSNEVNRHQTSRSRSPHHQQPQRTVVNPTGLNNSNQINQQQHIEDGPTTNYQKITNNNTNNNNNAQINSAQTGHRIITNSTSPTHCHPPRVQSKRVMSLRSVPDQSECRSNVSKAQSAPPPRPQGEQNWSATSSSNTNTNTLTSKYWNSSKQSVLPPEPHPQAVNSTADHRQSATVGINKNHSSSTSEEKHLNTKILTNSSNNSKQVLQHPPGSSGGDATVRAPHAVITNSGGDAAVRAPHAVITNSGGDATVRAPHAVITNSSGDATVRAPHAVITNSGGDATVRAPHAVITNSSGDATVRAPHAVITNSSGDATVRAPHAVITNSGGDAAVRAPHAVITNSGGDATVRAPHAVITNSSGDATVRAPHAVITNSGGDATVRAPHAVITNSGGDATVRAPHAVITNSGGDATVRAPHAVITNSGGDATVRAPHAVITNSGGDATVRAPHAVITNSSGDATVRAPHAVITNSGGDATVRAPHAVITNSGGRHFNNSKPELLNSAAVGNESKTRAPHTVISNNPTAGRSAIPENVCSAASGGVSSHVVITNTTSAQNVTSKSTANISAISAVSVDATHVVITNNSTVGQKSCNSKGEIPQSVATNNSSEPSTANEHVVITNNSNGRHASGSSKPEHHSSTYNSVVTTVKQNSVIRNNPTSGLLNVNDSKTNVPFPNGSNENFGNIDVDIPWEEKQQQHHQTSSTKISENPFDGLPSAVENIYREKGITKLYDWQREVLTIESVKRGSNLVFSLPTSGGKSFVAEVLLLRAIALRRSAILILPFIALVDEKVSALSAFCKPLDFDILTFAGSNSEQIPEGRVFLAICTIEKANSLVNGLITDPSMKFNIGSVVIDELHMIGEDGRGPTLELLLTKVTTISERVGTKCQIIGMSATIPNLSDVAIWLDAVLYESQFRPVTLQQFIRKPNGDIISSDREVVRKFESDPKIKPYERASYDVLRLVEEVAPKHGTLLFCSSKKACQQTALWITSNLSDSAKNYKQKEREALLLELRMIASGTIEQSYRVCIAAGVAYHHAGLLGEERHCIEAAYKKRIICVLCCTTTLSAGVNLPAKRVIIRSPYTGPVFLTKSIYLQMCGRAGRAGLDSSGESYLITTERDLHKCLTLSAQPTETIASKANSPLSIEKLLVDIVATKLADDAIAMSSFIKNTFLWSQNITNNLPGNNEAYLKACQDLTNELDESHIFSISEEKQIITCTSFGATAFRSGFSSSEASRLHKEFQEMQNTGLILSEDLHMLYYLTPIQDMWTWRVDWGTYAGIFANLSSLRKAVAQKIGISEAFILNKSVMGDSNNTSNTSCMDEYMSRRFLCSLMLADLLNEVPVQSVASRYKVDRGQVQNLQSRAAIFTSMMVSFAESMGWSSLQQTIKGFVQRIGSGVRADCAHLTEISGVQAGRARCLFSSGFRDVATIAKSDPETLFRRVKQQQKMKNGKENQTAKFFTQSAAKGIIAAAKRVLIKQVEDKRRELALLEESTKITD